MFISQRQNLRTFGYVWWQREKERIKTVLMINYTYLDTVRKLYNTETHGNVKFPMIMATLNHDFIFDEDMIDAVIRALENEIFRCGLLRSAS